ncbi:hypothetical protein AMECASPLE_030561 [Ameca splendens]|uniref:Uncharacterized protein n=1 Tax=Ameca splendens TaxID=208324 RepID=A0ABV0Y6N3_9TELE
MPISKEIQEQMRNKVIDIHQSRKGSKDLKPPTNYKLYVYQTMDNTWKTSGNFPGVSDLLMLLQEYIKDSSRRSKRNPEHHVKYCRPHLLQLRSVLMVPK